MKKKIFAALLAFAMVFSLLPTAVIATDEPAASVEAIDPSGIHMLAGGFTSAPLISGYKFTVTAGDPTDTSVCDFVVTFDKDVAAGEVVLAGEVLVGQSRVWTALPVGATKANAEVSLMQGIDPNLTFAEVYLMQYFQCGVVTLPAGVTMTVSFVCGGKTLAAESYTGKYAAQIGDTKYATLAEAISAVPNAETKTITLLTDLADIGTVSLPAGVTLDGDNHKISGDSAISLATAGGTVQNVVFENIHNTTGASDDDCEYYGWNDGKIGTLSAIYASGLIGSATITGCSFDNIDWDAIQITPPKNADALAITITDNIFKHTGENNQLRYVHVEHVAPKNSEPGAVGTAFATFNITNNQFYNTDLTQEDSICIENVRPYAGSVLNGNYIEGATNTTAKVFPGTMTMLKLSDFYPMRSNATVDVDDLVYGSGKVAKIGDIEYDTLAEAVAAANAKNVLSTIVLQQDVVIDETLEINNGNSAAVAIDLNGHTLTATVPAFKVTTNMSYGSANGGYTVMPDSGELFIFNGGTIELGMYEKFSSSAIEQYIDQSQKYCQNESPNVYAISNLTDPTASARNRLVRANISNRNRYFTSLEETVEAYKVAKPTGTGFTATLLGNYAGDLDASGKAIYITINVQTYSYEGRIKVDNGKYVSVSGTGAATFNEINAPKLNQTSASTIMIQGGKLNELNKTNGTLTITGGMFGFDPSAYVAPGYASTANTDSATRNAYPYVVNKVEVEAPKEVTVDDTGKVTTGSGEAATEVQVTVNGEAGTKDTVTQEVVAAINAMLDNPNVTNYAGTGIDEATPASQKATVQAEGYNLSMILDKLREAANGKSLTTAPASDGAALSVSAGTEQEAKVFGDADVSKTICISLTSAATTATETQGEGGTKTVLVSSAEFEVTPKATIAVTKSDGSTETVTAIVPNEAITVPITFYLPVPEYWDCEYVTVTHAASGTYSEETFNAEVLGEGANKYVRIASQHFSKFRILAATEDESAYLDLPAAAVNGKQYTLRNFQAAVDAAQDGDGSTMILLNNININGFAPDGEPWIIYLKKNITVDRSADADGRPYAFSVVHLDYGTEDPTVPNAYHFIFTDILKDYKVKAVVRNAESTFKVDDPITVDIVLTDGSDHPLSSAAGAYVSVDFTNTFATVPNPEELPDGWSEDGNVFTFYGDDGLSLTDGVLGSFALTAAAPTLKAEYAATDYGEAALEPKTVATIVTGAQQCQLVPDAEYALMGEDYVSIQTADGSAKIIGELKWADGSPTANGKTYNAKAWDADDVANYTAAVVDGSGVEVTYTRTYAKGETDLGTTAPTDAGDYTVTFDAMAPGYLPAESVVKSFKIKQAELVLGTLTGFDNLIYDGKAQKLISGDPSVSGVEGETYDLGTPTFTYTNKLGEGSEAAGWSGTAEGTYTVTCKVSVTNPNYKETQVTATAKIIYPKVVTIKQADYISGYTMVYMFVAGEARPKYDGQKVYKIDDMGYWFDTAADEGGTETNTLKKGTLDVGWHAYACLVPNETGEAAKKLPALFAHNQGLAGTIQKNYNLFDLDKDGIYKDVNGSKKVDLADAVAVLTAYHANYTPAQLTNYMVTILRSDIDRNGLIEVVDTSDEKLPVSGDALLVKNAILPITETPNE